MSASRAELKFGKIKKTARQLVLAGLTLAASLGVDKQADYTPAYAHPTLPPTSAIEEFKLVTPPISSLSSEIQKNVLDHPRSWISYARVDDEKLIGIIRSVHGVFPFRSVVEPDNKLKLKIGDRLPSSVDRIAETPNQNKVIVLSYESDPNCDRYNSRFSFAAKIKAAVSSDKQATWVQVGNTGENCANITEDMQISNDGKFLTTKFTSAQVINGYTYWKDQHKLLDLESATNPQFKDLTVNQISENALALRLVTPWDSKRSDVYEGFGSVYFFDKSKGFTKFNLNPDNRTLERSTVTISGLGVAREDPTANLIGKVKSPEGTDILQLSFGSKLAEVDPNGNLRKLTQAVNKDFYPGKKLEREFGIEKIVKDKTFDYRLVIGYSLVFHSYGVARNYVPEVIKGENNISHQRLENDGCDVSIVNDAGIINGRLVIVTTKQVCSTKIAPHLEPLRPVAVEDQPRFP